jgi:uncharacterized protein YggE
MEIQNMRTTLALLSIVLLSSTAFAAGKITVAGSGQVKLRARNASMHLTYASLAPTAAAAEQANALKVNGATAALRAELGAGAKITTDQVYAYPEYTWENDARVFQGYKVTQTLKVKGKNSGDVLGKMLRVGAEAQAENVWGPQAEPTAGQVRTATLKAKTRAVFAAKKEASLLARAAGASLGQALEIGTQEQGGYRAVGMRAMALEAAGGAEAPVAEINLEAKTVTAAVNVVFELLDAPVR